MQQLKQVVLDTGAFISDSHRTLTQLAAENVNLVTVPQVIEEIKDKATKEAISALPFKIRLMSPSSHAVAQVIKFSKECGEFYELSATDLLVLALTYQLETEENGIKNIREKPSTFEELRKNTSTVMKKKPQIPVNALKEDQGPPKSLKESSEGEWITPENFDDQIDGYFFNNKSSKQRNMPSSSSLIACMTQDFGMQNVMGQMGLRLLSINGRTLHKIRHWALGCFGCREITNHLDKEFCPACGGHTLIRVGVYINSSNGEISYKWFNSKNGSLNSSRRGVVYSIPKPKGGRKNDDIILREDVFESARAKTGYRGPNYRANHHSIDNWESKSVEDSTSWFSLSSSKRQHSNVRFGHGKRNPNEVSRSRK